MSDTEKDERTDKGGKQEGSYAGIKAVTSFDEMGLKDDLLRGIYAYGLRFSF